MKWMLTVWCFAVYQKCANSEYSNYQVISLLSAAYRLLPNIVLYNVTVCVEKIIGNSQFGLRCIDYDRSHIVYWWDCGGWGIVRGEGSADCKKSYDSVRTLLLFNFSISVNQLFGRDVFVYVLLILEEANLVSVQMEFPVCLVVVESSVMIDEYERGANLLYIRNKSR